MPRRLKLASKELGNQELFLVYRHGEVYETGYEALSGLQGLLVEVPRDLVEHALRGWTQPLTKALGLNPEGLLRKWPEAHRECHARKGCPFFVPQDCYPSGKKTPLCFEPTGLGVVGSELVRLSREGVWVIVVQEVT